MTKCSFPDCTKKVFARGLCVTHYQRQYRYGDAAATLKPGRPRLRPEDPASPAVGREIAALREECAALRRQLAEAEARPAAPRPGEDPHFLWERIRVLIKENDTLKKQLADARAANPLAGWAEEAAAGKLARENDRLENALAKAESTLATDPGEVGKLQRGLKAAKTRARNGSGQGPDGVGGRQG